jgi:hypothetical protein
MSNNAQFDADLQAFARAVGQSLDKTVRAITIEWFSSTVLSTPVDTGRLRGNWQLTIGAPASSISATLDPTGSVTLGNIVRGVGGMGKVTYLTNNLDYASKIEYGGSPTKAPRGMVRINFARIKGIINRTVASNAI